MRYLHRLARSDHLAEELHQQAWLSVLEHIDKFDPGVNSGRVQGVAVQDSDE